jgi:NADP-dependent 3-hydroxy acid dehydrogenase YdfG
MRELSDQVIAITGATSGLGRYLAGALAAAGASLVVHGRDPARLHQLGWPTSCSREPGVTVPQADQWSGSTCS